jgi:hypothetical protein
MNGIGTLAEPAVRPRHLIQLSPLKLPADYFDLTSDYGGCVFYYDRTRAMTYDANYNNLVAPFVARENTAADDDARFAIKQECFYTLGAHLIHHVVTPWPDLLIAPADPPSFLLLEREDDLQARRMPVLEVLTNPAWVVAEVSKQLADPFYMARKR